MISALRFATLEGSFMAIVSAQRIELVVHKQARLGKERPVEAAPLARWLLRDNMEEMPMLRLAGRGRAIGLFFLKVFDQETA